MEKSIAIFKESCKELGISDELPIIKNPKHEKALQANYMLAIIAEAKHKKTEYEPDWSDNTPKWFPVFIRDIKDGKFAGFRFGDSYCVAPGTCTGGGSRLCFKTEADADWFGRELLPLHNEWLVIQK